MSAYVVTEGAADERFASWLLGDLILKKGIVVKSASGKSSAVSLATSLAVRGNAVALLIDADNFDTVAIKSQKDHYWRELRKFGPTDCTYVCMIVPTLEAVVFSDKSIIEDVIGRPIRPEEELEAKYEPKKVLGILMQTNRQPLAELMDRVIGKDPSPLRRHLEITRLWDFLEKLPVPAPS